MGRTRLAVNNIIWGMINKVLTLLLPFILRSILIYTMGNMYVGLGSLFTSILGVLNMAELGFGSAIVFSMYKPIAEGDDEKVCQLLSYYRKWYKIIGSVILIIGILLLPFLRTLIKGDVPQGVNIYVLYLIYLLNTVISYFLFAYKSSVLYACQRNDISSKVSMILAVLQNFVQAAVLLLFANYYIYIIIMPIITVIGNIVKAIIVDKYYPQYKCKGELDKKSIKIIHEKIKGLIYQKVGGVVLDSVDSIVISAFIGLSILGKYNNYFYIVSSVMGFMAIFMDVLCPSVGNSLVRETEEKNYRDFKKFNFMYVWITAWCSICLLCLLQPFVKIWLGEDMMLPMGLVVLMALYFYVHKWCDMSFVYQQAEGLWLETRFVPIIAAALNLTLNLVLVNYIGLYGILLSTIISIILVYDLGYAIVIFGKMFSHENGLLNYILGQLKFAMIGIICAIITIGITKNIIMDNQIVAFILKLGVCAIVPNIVYALLSMRTTEFKDSIDWIKGFIKNRKG